MQDWVVDAYVEYAEGDLDRRSGHDLDMEELEGSDLQRRRGSSKKYIVHPAVSAVRSNSERYLRSQTKAGWTADNHAIRFVARIIHEGRASGRWWDHRFWNHDLEDLCTFGWLLMGWLRCLHSLTTATSRTSQYERANHLMWIELLNSSRSKRRLDPNATAATPPTAREEPDSPSGSRWQTPVDPVPSFLANPGPASPWLSDEIEQEDTSFSGNDSESGESFHTAPEDAQQILHTDIDNEWIEQPPSREGLSLPPDLQLPRLPAYTVKVCKKPQSKGSTSIWLLQSGKDRFMALQQRLLSS